MCKTLEKNKPLCENSISGNSQRGTGPARPILKAFVGGNRGSILECVKRKTLKSGLGFQDCGVPQVPSVGGPPPRPPAKATDRRGER